MLGRLTTAARRPRPRFAACRRTSGREACRLASRPSPSSSPERAAPAPPARRPRGSRGNGGGRLRRPQERPGDRGRPGLVRGLGAPLPPERDRLRGAPLAGRRGSTPPTGARRSRTRTRGAAASASPPGTRPKRCASRASPSSASPRPCPRSRRSPRPRSPSATRRARERRPSTALGLEPGNARSLELLGDALVESGDFASAREPYRLSLEAADEPRVRKKLDALVTVRRLRLERAVPHPLRRRRRRAARPGRPAACSTPPGRSTSGASGSRRRCRSTVVLQTATAFRDTTRAPDWAAAWNDGTIRVPVAGLDRPTPGLVRVLRHELAHSFVAARAGSELPHLASGGPRAVARGRRPRARGRPGSPASPGSPACRASTRSSAPSSDCREAAATVAYAQSLSAVAHLLQQRRRGRRCAGWSRPWAAGCPPRRRCPRLSGSATPSCSGPGRPTCAPPAARPSPAS